MEIQHFVITFSVNLSLIRSSQYKSFRIFYYYYITTIYKGQ